jgi:hypothetical protein
MNRNKRRFSMDRIMRARPSSSMVVALIALFVALIGTAQAVDGPLPGQNQVGSADIINNEVRTEDIRDNGVNAADIRSNAVTTGKIGDGEVRTADVLDDSLTPTDIADIGFMQSDTARLTDPNAGGGSAGQQLFTIGRVTLNSFCSNNGGGSFTAGISPNLPQGDTGADPRPVMVTDGNAGAADDDVELVPFDVQFVAILNGTDVAAREVSFAILDSENTSASGVAAVSVDPATESCVITAQAVG